MNKILCPIDFSDTSINALEFATEIAKKHHSSITLLNVFTEKDFNRIVGAEALGKTFKELLAMATAKLKSLADAISNLGDVKEPVLCDYRVELGSLTDQLMTLVKEEHYDYIIMGTTGISRGNGIFFGSQTEDVIEKLTIPILCIPEGATFSGFKKLVYASDFAEEDKLAIQEVISFATIFDARVSVLHINQGEGEQFYRQYVEELSSFIQYKKISFVNREFKSSIGLGLDQYMQEENSDLLVVFKQHRSFVKSIFHKSLTKILAYSTDKPLLVLKLEA